MSRQSDRSFGFMFAAMLTIVVGVGWLVFSTVWVGVATVAASFLILALLAPGILMPLNRIWVLFARRLGALNNHIILGLFFFLVMTPFALLVRLFGWDPMRRKIPDHGSLWTDVGRDANLDNFQDMF